jgi:phosphopantothenoylcysteine decarboxylase/phosphopantothenate--cysteine ligase
MLLGKKIVIGITGSIAAYKSILLVRLLIKEGAEVKVVITPAAKDFVSPLVLSTLSKNKVVCELSKDDTWENHVQLGRWADVMIIAPLTCNTLAKMAAGICDNLLLAVYLSSTCPVVAVPAMDEDMWQHPSTQKNIATIQSYNNKVITVNNGELASGLFGMGRMAEPEEILIYLTENFFRTNEFIGRKILVTAGPTHEPIDPVRYITNHSSGKMGFAIAEAFYKKGADVVLISGPVAITTPFKGIQLIQVKTAGEMYNACIELFDSVDIAVMSAAVADYSPFHFENTKIKKSQAEWNLPLLKTKDILLTLGEKKTHQFLVGFALETNNEKENALQKLKNKHADCIVLNSLQEEQTGFGFDTNKISILYKDGIEENFSLKLKQAVAEDIVQSIQNKINA